MENRKQVGINGGRLMALGKWPSGKNKGKMVKFIETLSMLCLAPPGTGKTAGLVVPTIVSDDNITFIVNDPKPELWEFTAHYRSEVSYTFMLNWSKVDQPHYVYTFNKLENKDTWNDLFYDKDPENRINPFLKEVAQITAQEKAYVPPHMKEKFEKQLEDYGLKAETVEAPVFYPRFNFLSKSLVPPIGPERDTYLDTVAKTLIPDKKEGDSYFTNKGRAALTGFMHMIVAKVGDAEDYSGIPAQWKDKEPSLPMLSDWIAVNQFDATGSGGSNGNEEENETNAPQEEEQGNPNDKIGTWLRKVTKTLRPKFGVDPAHKDNQGTTERGFMELSQLVNMADKERSGILGSMDEALLPFKNAAVKQRTSACDFTPDDMRGILNSDLIDPKSTKRDIDALKKDPKNWKPVTLYMSINQADAKAFSSVTSLLYEVLSKNMIAFDPGSINTRTNNYLGPFPVCFALDEFAKLPRIDAVIEGPDLGRSKKTSYMLVAQAYGQIEVSYTKEHVKIINSTTAAKHILPQNDAESIEMIQKMVGKTTIRDRKKSATEGFSKQANPLAANVSEDSSGINFLRSEDIGALPPGKNILIVQGFPNRPMLLDLPMYFEDPILAPKVYPGASRVPPGVHHPRTPGPQHYMPQHLYNKRYLESKEELRLIQERNVREDNSPGSWKRIREFEGIPINIGINATS